MSTPRHILVIKLGALGDFIQALGPMAAIKKHHPDDKITLLTTSPFEALAKASNYFDEIWLDKRPRWHDFRGWLAQRRRFNEGKFARVYDLQNNDRTAFYLKIFSPRPEWVGAAPGASHRNASPERTAGKAFEGHVQTLGLAGIKDVTVDRLEWLEAATPPEITGPYVLIVPGSAPAHPYKRWPLAHYIAFCKQLVAAGLQPVLIGSKAEADLIAELHAGVPGSVSLLGKTALFDIAALARGAKGAVGNDTGPMHLVAPTGCRSIILFSGKSKPHRHAPMGAAVVTLQKENLNDLNVADVWQTFERQQSAP